jgi:hypothetical protein
MRASDLNHAAGPGNDGQSEAVQPGNCGYQVQAEPEPWRVSRFIGAVETSKHGVTLVFAYTGAGILDAHNAFALAGKQSDFHPPSAGSEFDRVIDEVGDGLDQQIPIPVSG